MTWIAWACILCTPVMIVVVCCGLTAERYMEKKREKLWGIWIPSLGHWLGDPDDRTPWVTDLKREAVRVVQRECVNPKNYEVKEYVEAIPDAGDGIGSTFTDAS